MKTFNQEQLKQYNGQDGQPIYIAVGDKVYDVSGSKLWRGGMHMKRHPAGQDLTSDIQAAPHTREVLERYPQIGVLEKEADESQGAAPGQEIPPWLAGLLEKVPMLRRHPHPMTVHFPIAFMFAVPVFSFLYLLTGIRSFDTTAFNCLGAGVIFTLVAMGTGYYTWWLNYMAQPLRQIRIKKRLAPVLVVLGIAAFCWRWADPTILRLQGGGIVYCLIVAAFVPIVTLIGWHGASMTFPVHEE